MTKRSHDEANSPVASEPASLGQDVPPSVGNGDAAGIDDGSALVKKARVFMATLACDTCRARKSKCDEDRPRCGYCKTMNIECSYQTPRATKKDQSMALAINAIRRLEIKIETLSAAINTAKIQSPRQSSPIQPPPPAPEPPTFDQRSPAQPFSQPSPGTAPRPSNGGRSRSHRSSVHDIGFSPQAIGTPGSGPSPYPVPETYGKVNLSFSQHGVALWPAVKQVLPSEFVAARDALPKDYIVAIESQRAPLSMLAGMPFGQFSDHWLTALPVSTIKGLADAYFAVFHRSTPVLDKFHFFSHTLGMAMETDFGYDVETCVVLNVLALGCLAVKTHEEGDFPLPSRFPVAGEGFARPEWYDLTLDHPAGLRFFNEARKRSGFLMCQSDLQTAQFYMLSTLYYAQVLRPFDSWITVSRAALGCVSILKRSELIDFDEWEGDMFSRVFWNTLMYESIISQELDLPLSGLLEYEADMPIPKFTPCPRPKTSISGLLVDEDDSFFNFHFLAQAAHRIILTRIRHNLYHFMEKEGSPTPSITAEMHHQLEQWRSNLPPSLQFSDTEDIAERSPTPAHVIAKAMLRSRYLVAKFHIGRPFLYKALHYPAHTTEAEYGEARAGLAGGMYWPTTMGLCTQMVSALPVKFGWCSQCFGQVLLFQAVARSPDARLRECLPVGWQQWVAVMMELISACGEWSPGIAKDAELLGLL